MNARFASLNVYVYPPILTAFLRCTLPNDMLCSFLLIEATKKVQYSPDLANARPIREDNVFNEIIAYYAALEIVQRELPAAEPWILSI